MRKFLFIKIGGSLTTNKEKIRTANPAFIRKFAREFAAVYRDHSDWRIVLGTGVGSYAHFSAHQYGLREGAKTPEQFYGLAVTHSEAQHINLLITQALMNEHVPAFSLAPSSLLTANNRTIETSQFEPLKLLLMNNCVPVVYGDTILDRTRGTTIFSTEVVLQATLKALAGEYSETCAVYITKTNGVLGQTGKTIRELKVETLVPILKTLEHDVSGGMSGKAEAARTAAKIASRVYIIGPDMQKLRHILAGQDADTRVLPG